MNSIEQHRYNWLQIRIVRRYARELRISTDAAFARWVALGWSARFKTMYFSETTMRFLLKMLSGTYKKLVAVDNRVSTVEEALRAENERKELAIDGLRFQVDQLRTKLEKQNGALSILLKAKMQTVGTHEIQQQLDRLNGAKVHPLHPETPPCAG